MDIISSNSNKNIKNIIQLQKSKRTRSEQGVYVCEGRKLFEEARDYCMPIKQVFMSEKFYKEHVEQNYNYLYNTADKRDACCETRQSIYQPNRDFEVFVVKDNIFNSISETITPQGIISVIKQMNYSLEEVLELDNVAQNKARYLLIENVQDPGNLGTMLRTAEAAGMSAVIMSSDTVDIYSPKVIRSTMGAIFRIPFIYVKDFQATIKTMQQKKIKIFAAYLRDGIDYTEADYSGSCGIIIGNEGNGITDETVAVANQNVFIPMCGKSESLNAAVAAAILMYKIKEYK